MPAITDLHTLLSTMQPMLHAGRYAYTVLPTNIALDASLVIASIREPEGLSVIVAEQTAIDHGLPIAFVAAWIMLTVHSDLAAVGLTVAFSKALGDAGISCNVVAGTHHDHVFVPVEQAERAMEALHALQRSATE